MKEGRIRLQILVHAAQGPLSLLVLFDLVSPRGRWLVSFFSSQTQPNSRLHPRNAKMVLRRCSIDLCNIPADRYAGSCMLCGKHMCLDHAQSELHNCPSRVSTCAGTRISSMSPSADPILFLGCRIVMRQHTTPPTMWQRPSISLAYWPRST